MNGNSMQARLKHWLVLSSTFFSLQLLTQLVGFLTGVALVRLLPVSDFGRYTILISVQGTCVVLADIGVSNAISSLGGQNCNDKGRFSQIVVTAFQFRRRLQILSLSIGVPLLAYLLWRAGTPKAQMAMMLVALVLAVQGQVLIDVFGVVPVLYLKFRDAQIVNLTGTLVRFLTLIPLCYVMRLCWIAAMAFAASTLFQGWMMRRTAAKHIPLTAQAQAGDRAEISRIVLGGLVASVYYAFSPQISLLVVSIFGNVQRVAEVGALGRLAVVMAGLNGFIGYLVVPRFARLSDPRMVRKRYLQTVGLVSLVALALFVVAAVFPSQTLWVIGKGYRHLSSELVLLVASAACGLVINCMSTLNNCRAWVRGSWIFVPTAIVIQILLALTLDLSTTRGAILLGWGGWIAPFVGCVTLARWGLQMERERERMTMPVVSPEV